MPETPDPQYCFGMLSADAMRAFVEQHTAVSSPPSCAEIRLRLAPDLVALWEALETALGRTAPPPFWAHAWVGGQVLARYLLDTPAAVADKHVLDFGAGGGIVAIAAARSGAAATSAADIDPMARLVVPINAALNLVDIKVTADNVMARDLEPGLVVLAGDLWYERHFAERATHWLRCVAGRGHTVLIGDRRRAFFPKSGLEAVASYEINTSIDVEPDTVSAAGVWRVVG